MSPKRNKGYGVTRGNGGIGSGKSQFVGLIGTIFGAIALLIALITFGIAIGQLDTAYTAAEAYTDQVGLTDVMGIWGMVIFVIFMAVGLSAVIGSSVMQWKKIAGGGWTEIFIGVIMGTVSVVVALILNTLIQAQLHAAQVTVNATTNVANFPGLVDIMTIWGMVIFLTLISAGVSSLLAASYGGYRQMKGGM